MRLICFDGYLGADAEVKTNSNGSYVIMRVVNHEYVGGRSDDMERRTDDYWFTVITSNPMHVGMAMYLTKGRKLFITGKYADGIYMSEKERTVKVDRTVRAFEITFGDFKKNNDSSESSNEISGSENTGNIVETSNDTGDAPF